MGLGGAHNQSYNHSVKSQHFGKDQNQDHADKEAWLLCKSSDSGITRNSNCVAGAQTTKTTDQSTGEL